VVSMADPYNRDLAFLDWTMQYYFSLIDGAKLYYSLLQSLNHITVKCCKLFHVSEPTFCFHIMLPYV
jgi:hypothetical protein